MANSETIPFFEIFYLSLPLVTHFTKWAYEVTSPFGRSPIHLSGWRHLWMAPKEEGKCLSASEHHRITPSYTDSTSELPLLSFVFSSIFFSLSKFLTHTERLYFSAFVGKKTFSIKMLPNFSVIMSLPPPIFFKKEWWHRRSKTILIRE